MLPCSRTLAVLACILVLPTGALAQTPYGVPTSYAGVTRAEFVRMTLDVVGGYAYDGTHCFTDVTAQYYAPHVCAAKMRGIVTGHPDGRFDPERAITFLEASAIAVRAKGTHVSIGSPWYVPYLQQMAQWSAIPTSVRSIFDTLSPAQAREMIASVVKGVSADSAQQSENIVITSNKDMRVSLSAPEQAERGDRLTFVITVENSTTRDIRPVVRARMDDGMRFVSATRGGDATGTVVNWERFTLRKGDKHEFRLTVRIRTDVALRSTLRLRVEADDLRLTKGVTISDDVDEEDIRLTVSDADDPVERNGILTYRIRLHNRSDDDVTMDVRAVLERSMNYVSSTDNGTADDDEVRWKRIVVDADAVKTLLLTVQINDRARAGDTLRLRVDAASMTVTETTRVEDDGADADDAWDVNISVTDSPDPAEPGDIVRYRITVRNNENRDIAVDVIAELDDAMTYYSATQGGRRSGSTVRWDALAIDKDSSVLLLLDVRISSSVDDGDTLLLRVKAGDDVENEWTDIEY